MNTTSSSRPSAPGTLRRSVDLLRLLCTFGQHGASLTELSTSAGLPHPTVHRLLRQLMAERLVRQDSADKRYALGAMAFELGIAAASQFDMRHIASPVLSGLAREAGDTAFLSIRSGDEAVCLDLQQGPNPIRVVTLHPGSRRPLGVGAGGLAILGALGSAERESIIARLMPELVSKWRLPERELNSSLRLFAEEGCALIRNRVHLGVSAVGIPVCDPQGRPYAALSVAAINERMRAGNIGALVDTVRRAARKLQAQLARS